MEQSSSRAWSKAPVGMEQAPGEEQAPGGYREMQRRRRRGGALTQHPWDTTMAWRGSAPAATTASSQGKSLTIRRRSTQLTKPISHRGQGLATREQARGHHGRGPKLRRRKGMRASRGQSSRSHGQAEPPSLDLSIEHHLNSGHRWSSWESTAAAARRRSRQGECEREEDASERGGKRPVGPTEPLVGFDQ
jgi:hypothetical protein